MALFWSISPSLRLCRLQMLVKRLPTGIHVTGDLRFMVACTDALEHNCYIVGSQCFLAAFEYPLRLAMVMPSRWAWRIITRRNWVKAPNSWSSRIESGLSSPVKVRFSVTNVTGAFLSVMVLTISCKSTRLRARRSRLCTRLCHLPVYWMFPVLHTRRLS